MDGQLPHGSQETLSEQGTSCTIFSSTAGGSSSNFKDTEHIGQLLKIVQIIRKTQPSKYECLIKTPVVGS